MDNVDPGCSQILQVFFNLHLPGPRPSINPAIRCKGQTHFCAFHISLSLVTFLVIFMQRFPVPANRGGYDWTAEPPLAIAWDLLWLYW